MSDRIEVLKTHKLYIGGKFVRSESGRTMAVESSDGPIHVSRASRKDLRDTVRIARKSQLNWAAKSAYNRGQILYRLAEMLEDRRGELRTSAADASTAIDRCVHYAGWTDKVTALLSTLNPVASAFVNYSMVGPTGIVVAMPHPEDGLTGMIEAVCVPLVMGNSVILLVPASGARLALALAEALGVSDMPGGVVNLLTGDLWELADQASQHDDLDLFWEMGEVLTAEHRTEVQKRGARMIRRFVQTGRASRPLPPHELGRFSETKTVWMSSYVPSGAGGPAY